MLSAIETGLNLRCVSIEKQVNDKVYIETFNALEEKVRRLETALQTKEDKVKSRLLLKKLKILT